MTHRMNRMAALAASGLALGGGVAMAALPAAATAGSAHRTVVRTCAGTGVVAPRDYTLYCGDGNDSLMKLQWTHWGAATTTATGKIAIDNCTPSCAAGKETMYPVSVKLSDRKHSAYGRITLHYTAKVPSGSHRTESYRIGAHGPVM